ncbi:MAG: TetR/AcrR family transcriptional regulator [Firmicutes bacterium HGW-Firmicutes-14]|nr:MAG: TetR/AcrR family transcriptional regulator [Firmicutes bacterium HGW-Firmicutes-14]
MSKKPTEVRKKQIIEAALDIIAEKGVSGLTTAETAEMVGFTEAALFNHFPSKTEILRAAVNHAHQSLFSGIHDITGQDLGPLTKLEAILKYQLSFLKKNRGIPRIIFSDELHLKNKDLKALLVNNHEKYMNVITAVIEEGIFSGLFRTDLDARMGAKAFFGLIQNVMFSSSLHSASTDPGDQFEPIKRFLRGSFIARSHCG